MNNMTHSGLCKRTLNNPNVRDFSLNNFPDVNAIHNFYKGNQKNVANTHTLGSKKMESCYQQEEGLKIENNTELNCLTIDEKLGLRKKYGQILPSYYNYIYNGSSNQFSFRSIPDEYNIFSQFPNKIKTELCSEYMSKNFCKFGHSCIFAHGEKELRPKQNLSEKYKTKLCKQYQENKSCSYGKRCWFIHSDCLETKNLNYSQILEENLELINNKLKTLRSYEACYESIIPTARLPVFSKLCSAKC